MKHWLSVRWILAVVLLPFAVLGLLILAAQLFGLVRCDPAYFTATYVERYQQANAAVRALEHALQTGDRTLLAELEGLRWPVRLPTSPDIAFVMFWDRTSRYSTYLYFDRQAFLRYLVSFESVNGRWVVAPRDLYFVIHSGGWKDLFLPLAGGWWLLGGILLGVAWLSRRSAHLRT